MVFGALGVIPDVVESTDPATLLAKIAESFTAQVTDTPDSQLVDVYLAGGGAGNVWEATLLYSTVENGDFPQLAIQTPVAFFGTDRKSVLDSVKRFYAAHGDVSTTFFDSAVAGDGAVFMSVLVYQPATVLAEIARVDAPAITAEEVDTLDDVDFTVLERAPPWVRVDTYAKRKERV